MNKIKLIAILLLCGRLYINSANQPGYYFTHIDAENGLSQNNVKSIIQDSWGFMWFGTRNKLNRYDGKSKKFFYAVYNHLKKTNNNISALKEDSDKKIWVGTDKGVFIFDPLTEKFSFFCLKTKNGGIQMNDWVSEIWMDKDDNIWIVIPNQGVFLYHFNQKILEYFKFGNNKYHDNGNPECMLIEQNGLVWIGTNGEGVYLYNKNQNNFEQYLGNANGTIINSLKGQNIYTMCNYGDEIVLGIHEGKLLKLHKKKKHLIRI